MKYRKLRIAWSVGWGILCLLMIVLWVRSYQWDEYVMVTSSTRKLGISSREGSLVLGLNPNTQNAAPGYHGYKIRDGSPRSRDKGYFGFKHGILKNTRAYALWATHWFAISVFAISAVLPWIRWRFSLRTLLIGMTLLAVALGFIIALAR